MALIFDDVVIGGSDPIFLRNFSSTLWKFNISKSPNIPIEYAVDRKNENLKLKLKIEIEN